MCLYDFDNVAPERFHVELVPSSVGITSHMHFLSPMCSLLVLDPLIALLSFSE